jgi:hypothetical protein
MSESQSTKQKTCGDCVNLGEQIDRDIYRCEHGWSLKYAVKRDNWANECQWYEAKGVDDGKRTEVRSGD